MRISEFVSLWTLGLSVPWCTAAPIVTEFVASNSSSLIDGNGRSPDWIEIYNPDSTPQDLAGFHLSDDPTNSTKWTFPATILPPNDFLIVFASGDNQPDEEGNLHTNFRLTSEGDYLSFSAPDGRLLSEFISPQERFPELAEDSSYGLGFTAFPPVFETLTIIGNSTSDGDAIEGNGSFEDTSPSTNPSGSGNPTRWAANGVGQVATIDGWSARWRRGFIGFDDDAAASDGAIYGFVNDNSDALFDSADHALTLEVGDVLNLDFDLTSNAEDGLVTVTVDLQFEVGSSVQLARYTYSTNIAGLFDAQSFQHVVTEEHAGENVVSVSIRLNNPRVGPVDQPRFDNVRLNRVRTNSIDLISTGDSTRWIIPEDSNIDNIWTSPSFDESSWEQGATPLGYESNPGSNNSYESLISTVTPTGINGAYLRQSFSILDREAITDLELSLQYDDGFIAYLNGSVVARQNAPTSPGFDSNATLDHPDSQALEFSTFSLNDHLDLLINGQNVLAIHALNTNDSSDFLISPRLRAKFNSTPTPSLSEPLEQGRLVAPTPGTYNTALRAGDLTFSRESGLFTEDFILTITSERAGDTIRYTLDDREPTDSSPIYIGPITIDTTTHLRARSFNNNGGFSPIFGASFVKMNDDLSNFSTHLPVIVIDNNGQGNPLDKVFRTTFTTVFEPNTQTGQTTLTSLPSLAERCAWHRRGSSSFTLGKPNYRLEFRDQTDRDKAVPLLGLPADADWILTTFARFDRALVRNPVAFDTSRELGIYAPRIRHVEIFFNQDGDNLEEEDYFGVYALSENIKRSDDRIDIKNLSPSDTSGEALTGGYIIKSDRTGSGDFTFQTNRGFPSEPAATFITVEPGGPEIAEEQKDYIRSYFQDFEDALYGTNFRNSDGIHYSEWIDVDSFIEQHLFQIIYKGPDALRFSTYFHKDRGEKLRFCPNWDQERIIGVETDTSINRARNPENWNGDGDVRDLFAHDWWGRLFEDPDFMQAWIDRWVEFEIVFNSSRMGEIFDRYEATLLGNTPLESPITRNFIRWGDSASNNEREAWPNARIRTSNNPDSNNFYQYADPSITAGATDPESNPTPTNILAYWRSEMSHVRRWTDLRLAWIYENLPKRAEISENSGPLAFGTEVSLISPGHGQLYYTTDGSDPRAPGGAPSSNALLWNGTPLTITETQQITVRVLDPNNANPRDQVLGQPNRYDVWSAPTKATFEVGPNLASSLVVSEFSYNPLPASAEEEVNNPGVDSQDFEFIEFLNTSPDQTINLVGAHFTDGVNFTFGNALLNPGDRGIIVRNQDAFVARYGPDHPILGTYMGGLSGGGEQVTLLDAFDNVIQSFRYDDMFPWPESPDGGGPSLVLIDPYSLPDHNNGQSWRPSLNDNGTPGIRGGTTYLGNSPAELLAYALPGGTSFQVGNNNAEITINRNPLAEDIMGAFLISPDLQQWSLANEHFRRVSQDLNGVAIYRFIPPDNGAQWFIQYRVNIR